MIIKNSKKEEDFINELKNIIDNIDTSNICGRELLEKTVQEYVIISESLQNKYSKYIKINKYSKVWQNKEYNTKLNTYYVFKSIAD